MLSMVLESRMDGKGKRGRRRLKILKESIIRKSNTWPRTEKVGDKSGVRNLPIGEYLIMIM